MPSAEQDLRLVEEALSGGTAPRRRLAERLLDAIQREVAISVHRPALQQGRDPRQEVQDLVQEVLVALFEHDARELRRWDPARGRNLESFVRLVARRRVARVLGQRRGNPWTASSVELQEGPDEEGLEERLEQRAQLGEVLQLLHANMSPRDVELFELLFVQGLEPGEAAEKMEMSRGAVNAWSYRMRKQARAAARHVMETTDGDSASAGRSR